MTRFRGVEYIDIIDIVAYASFKDWNPNAEIYDAAERLYGNIENLELYVGLQAEEAKPVVEGAGLCPGALYPNPPLSNSDFPRFTAQDTPSVAQFSVTPSPSLEETDSIRRTILPTT
jgi:hypothetical protein